MPNTQVQGPMIHMWFYPTQGRCAGLVEKLFNDDGLQFIQIVEKSRPNFLMLLRDRSRESHPQFLMLLHDKKRKEKKEKKKNP